jgi:hypothetical protein
LSLSTPEFIPKDILLMMETAEGGETKCCEFAGAILRITVIRVSWNSKAGWVSGRIVQVHTKDVNYKGYVHHAPEDDPQYEIKSDKTDHIG